MKIIITQQQKIKEKKKLLQGVIIIRFKLFTDVSYRANNNNNNANNIEIKFEKKSRTNAMQLQFLNKVQIK